ncbi:MAG: hypothetical protein U5L76_05730 [Patescibacteria group bacterium]|nr:hypothetical protein [Patescibacteria group bacterium]MDZ7799066.1 hypothetical protein [Patescibacteria group bacterium]
MSKKKKVKKIKNKKSASTQKYLDIMEIKDNCVILKDGTLRAVLIVSSINFSLKSNEEQDAVIQNYVQFLNSLKFNLQIVIQSRKLNIEGYLNRLLKIEKEQTNELLKMQTKEYRQYITELVEMADIMSKKFYVVIPYTGQGEKPKKFWNRLTEAISPGKVIHIKKKKFNKYKTQLFKQVDFVRDNLSSIGLRAEPLDTQSLIELYYNTYNPETYDQQKLTDVEKINLEK